MLLLKSLKEFTLIIRWVTYKSVNSRISLYISKYYTIYGDFGPDPVKNNLIDFQ